MKKLLLPVLLLLLAGCADDITNHGGLAEKAGVDTVKNVILFKVDGVEVKSTVWNIARFRFHNMTKPGLNITSNMHQEKRTVRFNLEDYRPGTYILNGSPLEGGSYGSYIPDYWIRGVYYPITGGQLTLTEVDTVHKVVNGTFYFTAKGAEGQLVNVTDGRIINGKLNLDISGEGR